MNPDIMLVLVSALVAMVNPSLLAATTVMMLLPHRQRLMTGYLLGAYTTSVVSGLAIVFSLQRNRIRAVVVSVERWSEVEQMLANGHAPASAAAGARASGAR